MQSRIPVKSPNHTREKPETENGGTFVKDSKIHSRNLVKSPIPNREKPVKTSNANKENSGFVKNPKQVVKPMMGVGSKIPLSNAKINKKPLGNQNSHQTAPRQRHSSPVKM